MALNPAVLTPLLKAQILAQLQIQFPLTDSGAIQTRDQMAESIASGVANALIPYLITNTQVVVVTPAGPGTGTIF